MPELKDLEVALRGSIPIIVIETQEEPRAVDLFIRFGMKLNNAIFRWSATEGLKNAQLKLSGTIENTDAPNDVLKYIKFSADEGYYLLLDFHPYLSDPIAIRYIKEIAFGFEKMPRRLIFITHSMDIPEELAPWCMRFHLQLPDINVLQSILQDEARKWQIETGSSVKTDKTAMNQMLSNLSGITTLDARRLIRQAIVDDGAITHKDVKRVQEAKYELFSKDGVIQYEADTASFSDVAGLANLKKWLKIREKALLETKADQDAPKGILLLGVQGSGKSLAAKAVAGQFKLPLLRLDMAALYNKYIGETEKNLRKALAVANVMSPCVVWIDEIEKALSQNNNDDGVSTRLLGTLLTWMAESNDGSFIVATSNDIESLPPELIRKGRLDEIFFVDLPDRDIRKEIFRIHLAKRKLNTDTFDLDKLAVNSAEFSGAEIEQAVISAIYSADAKNMIPNTEIVIDELFRTQPLAIVMSEKISRLRQWASGRTVAAN
ncbi:MAG: ATPase [Methylophaga sp.]|nr:MAG: ATPase [Methylophaga sp.]